MKEPHKTINSKNLIANTSRKLFALLKDENKDIWLLYVYAIISGIISLTLPLGVQAIITYLMGAYLSTSLVLLIALVIAGTFFVGVLQLFQLSIVEVLQQKIFLRSTFEYAFRLPLLKLNSTGKYLYQELANRFFDTLTLQKQVPKLLMDLSAAILQMLFGLILISFYHPFFAFFSLLIFLILFLFFRFSGPRGLASSMIESEEKYRIAFHLQRLGLEHFWFKAAQPFQRGLKQVDAFLGDYLDARKKHFKVLRSQYQVLILFKTLIISILLIIGGNLVLAGQINLGQFIAAEIVIILIMGSVEKLLLSMEGIYDVLTAVEKVAKVPEQEVDMPEGYALSENVSELSFQEVCFQLGRSFTIPDATFSLQENHVWQGGSPLQIMAFKRLLGGHIEPSEGTLRVDGLSINEWNHTVWRQKFILLESVKVVMNESVSRFLGIEEDPEAIKKALKIADIIGLSSRLNDFGLSIREPIEPLWLFNDTTLLWQLGIMRTWMSSAEIILVDLNQWPDALLSKTDLKALFDIAHKHLWVISDTVPDEFDAQVTQLSAMILEKGGQNA